jgi:hypothetical protein
MTKEEEEEEEKEEVTMRRQPIMTYFSSFSLISPGNCRDG